MLRIVPHTVPRVGRSYEHFPDGFELHLLHLPERTCAASRRRGSPNLVVGEVLGTYKATSPIKNSPPFQGFHGVQGTVLL